MDCESIRLLLDGFAIGELESSQRRAVEEHISECALCRKELTAIREAIRLLAEFGEVDEPSDFVQKVRAEVERRRRRFVFGSLLARPATAGVLAGAGSLLVAVFGVWLAFKQFSPSPVERAKERPPSPSKPKMIARASKPENGFLREASKEADLERVADGEGAGVPAESSEISRRTHDRDRRAPDGRRGTELSTEAGRVELRNGLVPHGDPLLPERARQAGVGSKSEPAVEAKNEWGETEVVLSEPVPVHGKMGVPAEPPSSYAARDSSGVIALDLKPGLGGEKEEELSETAIAAVPKLGQTLGKATETRGAAGTQAPPPTEEMPQKGYRPRLAVTEDVSDYAEVNGDVVAGFFLTQDGGQGVQTPKPLAVPEGAETGIKELHELSQEDLGRATTLNGAFYDRLGLTGQVQLEGMDAIKEERYHYAVRNLVTPDDSPEGSVRELVLYVRNRQEAVKAIRTEIVSLGGASYDRRDEASRDVQVFGGEKGELLVFKLTPGAYTSFVERLSSRIGPVQWSRRARGQTESPPVTKDVTQKKKESVTLVIRLIETAPASQTQPPPSR